MKDIITQPTLPLILAITHPDRFYEEGDPGLTVVGTERLGEILVPLRIIIGTKSIHLAHGTGFRFLSVYKFFEENLRQESGEITRTSSLFLGAPDANLRDKKDRVLASGELIPADEYLGITRAVCFSPWLHLWELLKKAASKHARVLIVLVGGEYMAHLFKEAGIKGMQSKEGQVFEIDFVSQLVRVTEVT